MFRSSRSFGRSSRSFSRSPRRGYSGLLPGVPCGTAAQGAISCQGPSCPPRSCPPQQACPEYEPCPTWPEPESCPECPPQGACPEYEPCPAWPEPEPCPECPPQGACPECPPQEECPPVSCEEACYALYGDGPGYTDCMVQNCGARTPSPPPVAPPRPGPPIMMPPVDVPCDIACKQAYGRGEISIEEFHACMDECCIEEGVAEGHSPAYAARLCGQTRSPPPATPFTYVPARTPIYPVA